MATINIDIEYIEKGVKDIYEFADLIELAEKDGMIELYQKTNDKMSELADSYGLSESSLAKSKHISIDNMEFEIGYTAPHAEFVEFGTGIIGQNTPYTGDDENFSDWEYNSGENIRPDGSWFYPKKDGTVGITMGQPSRPIVWQTKVWVRSQLTRTIRKHLRRLKI